MTEKLIFGNPFETYAVEPSYNVCEKKANFGTVGRGIMQRHEGVSSDWDDNGVTVTYSIRLSDNEHVYGLGENVRGINKRGWKYISKCADDPNHTEGTNSLYGAHNFLMIDGCEPFGLFIDYPGKIIFDVGFTRRDVLDITIFSDNFNMYMIYPEQTDKKLLNIVTQFRKLIGKSYVPPFWAFGYQQSRWGYKSADDIRAVYEGYHSNNIPIDAIYLDIDYMERYKDFTVDETTFPDFPSFVDEMKEKNIHLVPIIDAGVKIEKGYQTYEDGVNNNFFCKREDGSDFVCGVWPGKVHFPDVLNANAREWFGESYKALTDAGIDGFWNDMNEPAIFYSEEHLLEVLEKVCEYKGKELDINSFFAMGDLIRGLSNNIDDYKRFYHRATQPDGEISIRHDHVHNLFGYNMTRAASEAFVKLRPGKRTLLFSRASYIGMHRFSGIWMGDNQSWWSHLLMMVQMLPSLNMCGFLYIGADMCGFGCNATEDLAMRWTQSSMFVPLMRNHSAAGTREQELYRFTRTDDFRKMIEIRYGLIPYLYSEYLKANEGFSMMYRPLGFEFPEDEKAQGVEDQLFVGESLMMCPIYTQNALGRYVYLPEDMTLVRMRSLSEYDLVPYKKGHCFVDAKLNELIFFIRQGKCLPLSKGGMNTEEISYEDMNILHGEGEYSPYEMWSDDGITTDCEIERRVYGLL